jgi:hypothetical protein
MFFSEEKNQKAFTNSAFAQSGGAAAEKIKSFLTAQVAGGNQRPAAARPSFLKKEVLPYPSLNLLRDRPGHSSKDFWRLVPRRCEQRGTHRMP